MIRKLIGVLCVMLSGCLIVCVSTGCITEGHRKWSMEVLGSKFSIEDEAFSNQKGEQVYKTDFANWFQPTVDALFGWLKPKPEVDKSKVSMKETTTAGITPPPVAAPPTKPEK